MRGRFNGHAIGSIFLDVQPLRVGLSVRPITSCDFVNHQLRSGFVYRPA
jgi:hypothetical protein